MVALKIPSASARVVSSHVAVNQVNQLVPEVKVVMSHMRSCIDKENSPTESGIANRSYLSQPSKCEVIM